MGDFLWERVDEGKVLHVVKWGVMTKPLDFGGLGLGKLRAGNVALLALSSLKGVAHSYSVGVEWDP